MPLLHKKSTVSFMFYKTGGMRLIQKTKVKTTKGPGRPKLVKSVLLLSAEETASLADHLFGKSPKRKAVVAKAANKAKQTEAWKAETVPLVAPSTESAVETQEILGQTTDAAPVQTLAENEA